MKRLNDSANVKIFFIVIFTLFLLVSCKQGDSLQTPSKVEIKSADGENNFYVNGELFELKGAGGGGRLALLGCGQ